ncbi:MAG: tetratricopeptide repeat protein [Promethearchaeota archaeon]
MNSIKFLKQESNLLEGFNESRKLAQNYQNIAELYLKSSDFNSAIKYYEKVVKLSKVYNFFDMLSYSYQQIGLCFEELDDYNKSQEIILDGVDFFSDAATQFEELNENGF